MPNILVTGIGGPAGRNVSSLLLERNLSVIGTDIRTIDHAGIKFFLVPPANSPDFLSSIRKIAEETQADWIIPTVSEELPVFAGDWEWGDRFPTLISSGKAVILADDKYLTAETLFKKGIPVPRFVLPSQVHSPTDIAHQIGWPCISKPRIGRGGREVALHNEKDWPLLLKLDDRYILQEFATGTDYAPNVFVGKVGVPLAIVLEKTELKQGIVGNAVEVKRVDAPDIAEIASEAALALGLFGPLDIDIRRRNDGVPLVLEINARFGANIRHAPEILDAFLNML
jgi:carbamoylphosphate synthase large subunit